MATLVGTQSELPDVLRALVELEYDAIEAYSAAINRLEELQFKTRFEQFRTDHQQHVRDLSSVLQALGTSPPTGPDAKALLTQGKVVVGNWAGDRGILAAMHSNENDTNQAYERAVERSEGDPELRTMLQRNLDDERRHRLWIEDQLSTLGGSGGEILVRDDLAGAT